MVACSARSAACEDDDRLLGVVSGCGYVAYMSRRGSGTTGQYQASCEHGYCALTGRQTTSKLEGQIFTLLDYVLGPGKHDWRSQVCGRWVQIDMVFTLPDDRALVVEYDGARWHRSKEERDWRKARMIEEGWNGRKCVVVRM